MTVTANSAFVSTRTSYSIRKNLKIKTPKTRSTFSCPSAPSHHFPWFSCWLLLGTWYTITHLLLRAQAVPGRTMSSVIVKTSFSLSICFKAKSCYVYISGWPQAHRDPHVSASRALRLQVWATMHDRGFLLFKTEWYPTGYICSVSSSFHPLMDGFYILM